MTCKRCGKDIEEHGILSFRCPRYTTSGFKIGYQDRTEFKAIESFTSIQHQHKIDLNKR